MSRQVTCAQRPSDPKRGSGTRTAVIDEAPGRRTQLPLSPALRAQQARDLRRRLQPLVPGTLVVTVTDNKSVMISVQRDTKRRHYKVRLHHLFVDAPVGVVRLLGRYIVRGDRHSSRELNGFIDQRQDRIRDDGDGGDGQPDPIRTEGKVYDLRRIFDDLNARYFDNRVSSRITWGRRATPGRSRRSVKLGCYILELDLIRIHAGLDRTWIPLFYIEWVIFHEMLHSVHPIPTVNGRRRFHTPAFDADEKRYEHYALAVEWERRNIPALLRI